MIRVRSIQLYLPRAYQADAAMIGRAAGQAIGRQLANGSHQGPDHLSLRVDAGGASSLALVSKISQTATRNFGKG